MAKVDPPGEEEDALVCAERDRPEHLAVCARALLEEHEPRRLAVRVAREERSRLVAEVVRERRRAVQLDLDGGEAGGRGRERDGEGLVVG